MLRLVACLRCLRVEPWGLWQRLTAIWLAWNMLLLYTGICPMPLTQYFGVILVLGEFILILVHYLFYWVLTSFTSSSWSVQVVYRVSSSIRFLVIHRLRLHILMEMALFLEIACRLGARLVSTRSWNNLTWLRSSSVFCWFTVVSLIELLSGMLLAVMRIVSVLVTWMFRMTLLAITTRFNIFSISTRSTCTKARSRLGWSTTNPVSWIYWLRLPLASNTSLVFVSQVLIWLIHLLTFGDWLLGWATSTCACCTS